MVYVLALILYTIMNDYSTMIYLSALLSILNHKAVPDEVVG